MVLAGDSGGTSTRLACFELIDGRLRRTIMQKYPSRDNRGLAEIVRAFCAKGRMRGLLEAMPVR